MHSRSKPLQTLDNEANGRLAHARRVKIFEKLKKKYLVRTVTLQIEAKL